MFGFHNFFFLFVRFPFTSSSIFMKFYRLSSFFGFLFVHKNWFQRKQLSQSGFSLWERSIMTFSLRKKSFTNFSPLWKKHLRQSPYPINLICKPRILCNFLINQFVILCQLYVTLANKSYHCLVIILEFHVNTPNIPYMRSTFDTHVTTALPIWFTKLNLMLLLLFMHNLYSLISCK